MAQQPLVGQGLLIIEASRSHSDTSHSVGLLWTSDQPDAETSTWQHSIYKRQTSMPPTGFKPTIPAGEQLQTHALGRPRTRATFSSQLCSYVMDCNDIALVCVVLLRTRKVKKRKQRSIGYTQ